MRRIYDHLFDPRAPKLYVTFMDWDQFCYMLCEFDRNCDIVKECDKVLHYEE